jgi:XRE family aerobic/anaerobic benzoate catabolism transcriptional regulator
MSDPPEQEEQPTGKSGEAAWKEHMQRVTAQGDLRPMAGHRQAMEDLRAILAEREPAYGRAGAVLDTSGRDVTACLAELERLAAPFLAAESSEPAPAAPGAPA